MSQRTITSYYSPSPRKARTGNWVAETIDLVSSSPVRVEPDRPQTPSPGNTRFKFSRTSVHQTGAESEGELDLPSTVTKRRRRGPLKRARTAPAAAAELELGEDEEMLLPTPTSELDCHGASRDQIVEITSSSPVKELFAHADEDFDAQEDDLPSPAVLFGSRPQRGGGFLIDEDATPKAIKKAALAKPSVSHSQLRHLGEPRSLAAPDGVDESLEKSGLPGAPAASQSSLPSPPADEPDSPASTTYEQPGLASPPKQSKQRQPLPSLRRSPRHSQAPQPAPLARPKESSKAKKKIILPRASLAGAWKEISADSVEALDLTGDGSGWKASGGRAKLVGKEGEGTRAWRKSGVEVLDLTGA